MNRVKGAITKAVGQTALVVQGLTFVLLGSRRISSLQRLMVVFRVARARLMNRGRAASSFGEQLVLVNAILNTPPDKAGKVAEFGCFKGMSTIAISIAAKYAGRRVVVFDSFEGLPEHQETVHQTVGGEVLEYQKGMFAGTLEEVQSAISRYGEISQVEFVRGFFCDTLPGRPSDEKYVLIFEDADLVESVHDVLQYSWPRLQPGCVFFSHEAMHLEVAKLFFDDTYWLKFHGQRSPGLVGVGIGLPIDWGKWGTQLISGRYGSCLAAVVKA